MKKKKITLEKKTGLVEHYNLIFRDKDNKGTSMTSVSLFEEELRDLYIKVGKELRKWIEKNYKILKNMNGVVVLFVDFKNVIFIRKERTKDCSDVLNVILDLKDQW